MTDKEAASIYKIEIIRRDNNTLWMDILRIALSHSPIETKALLRGIRQNDKDITQHMRDLED